MFFREKLVLFLVNEESRANGKWENLYDQLSYRYCSNLYNSKLSYYSYLRFAVSIFYCMIIFVYVNELCFISLGF